ncbi:MAG TPA: tetratricopeptide repeat protein [Caulobacteraceae bacterium]|jgi:tetratricopeptide (TPR) repeat protein|nr:tetratricopeptide repeat protein [Caulobacteraceae bacterium]
MNGIKAAIIAAAATAVGLGLAGAASAQAVQVVGDGFGESCWRAAVATTFMHIDSAKMDARWKADAISACDDALKISRLDRKDTASTWVNRGILEMSRERYANARGNFKEALKIIPNLPEAHVDIGSALINMQKFDEGIKETELGLSMGSKEPERGYYNLGLAYGLLGNQQKAYESFRRASELNPAWTDPKVEMARFTVEKVERK